MHHITLCISCIALVNGGHLLHTQVDRAEVRIRDQKGASPRGWMVRKRQVAWILT
jgi:hypothetical protein